MPFASLVIWREHCAHTLLPLPFSLCIPEIAIVPVVDGEGRGGMTGSLGELSVATENREMYGLE